MMANINLGMVTKMLSENIQSGGKYYNDYKDNYFDTAI